MNLWRFYCVIIYDWIYFHFSLEAVLKLKNRLKLIKNTINAVFSVLREFNFINSLEYISFEFWHDLLPLYKSDNKNDNKNDNKDLIFNNNVFNVKLWGLYLLWSVSQLFF